MADMNNLMYFPFFLGETGRKEGGKEGQRKERKSGF